jgi:hypothetical protein
MNRFNIFKVQYTLSESDQTSQIIVNIYKTLNVSSYRYNCTIYLFMNHYNVIRSSGKGYFWELYNIFGNFIMIKKRYNSFLRKNINSFLLRVLF